MKKSLNINATRDGKKVAKTLGFINPKASNALADEFARKINALSLDTYKNAEIVKKMDTTEEDVGTAFAYTNADTSITISGNSIAVNISDDAANALKLTEDGLFVNAGGSSSGSSAVDISGKVDKVLDAPQGNIVIFGASGGIANGGLSLADLDSSGKVDKVAGKQLSTEDFTTAEKTKLGGISDGAQVNAIESVKVDGSALTVTDKAVNIDLSGKVDKVVGKQLSTEDFTTAEKTKLAGLSVVDISGKVDKVLDAPQGNIVIFGASGGITNGGLSLADLGSSGSSSDSILDSVSSTVDGALWYEIIDGTPKLWFHMGNYDYRYSHDSTRYVGGGYSLPSELVAFLPFTTSLDDLLENTWTPMNSPAITDGSLALNGSSYLKLDDGITLGGQDFTIDFKIRYESGEYTGYNNFWGFGEGANNRVSMTVNPESKPYILSLGEVHTMATNRYSFAETRHIATVYQHEANTMKLYVGGVNVVTLNTTIPRKAYVNFTIGAGDQRDFPARGAMNYFRIFDGLALWTEDFTPPANTDYYCA